MNDCEILSSLHVGRFIGDAFVASENNEKLIII